MGKIRADNGAVPAGHKISDGQRRRGGSAAAPVYGKTVKKGSTVTFTGGAVYKSSTAAQAAVTRNVTSTCEVTAVNEKGAHPYHCISKDRKGVYGWVDREAVRAD